MAKGIKTRRGESKETLTNYLYNRGDEVSSKTSGWVDGYLSGNGSQSKLTDSLYLYVSGNTSNPTRTYVTNGLIDLTGINMLFINWSASATTGDRLLYSLIVSTSKTGDHNTYTARTYFEDSVAWNKTSSLDVSSLSGSFYVRANITNAGVTNRSGSLNVHEIWGE